MNNIIIISNRLPITVQKNNDGKIEYIESIGGLSTGLKNIHQQGNSIWIGWPGIANDKLTIDEKNDINKKMVEEYRCLPVFLYEEEINQYYHGFCNKTIWPLFHYFQEKTEYDFENWEAYKKVNSKFFEAVESVIKPNDTVWVHDYQLMLLPEMIKTKYFSSQVGFFLHIPFPSTEIFKLLIWRTEILTGILGADLIGFHTYDYARHFLSSARRLLGLENNLNKIAYENRYVQVNAFPMGIEYKRFFQHCEERNVIDESDDFVNIGSIKTILSVDRLDYTKGIPQRIKSFGRFLKNYPEYQGKVILILIVAPSRVEVDSYSQLLKQIKERISEINGRYGTMKWVPILFFFRSFSQEKLIEFYRQTDVLLVTPLRDGMNLIAKEYIASRNDYKGMIVISETAGAASELGEAILVNANDFNSIAEGIKTALEMPDEEIITRNKRMHERLKRYNVFFWASEFLNSLNQTVIESIEISTQKNAEENIEIIKTEYKKANKRVLFLDYDGTLVGLTSIPEKAKPDEQIRKLLQKLASDTRNTVVIISGRDRDVLSKWLGDLNLSLIASHGLWLRCMQAEDWKMMMELDNDWKSSVRNIMEIYTDRMPGSFIEEKEYSLAWHYRQCDPDMVATKLHEIKDALISMIQSSTLELINGNKVLEVNDSRFNKGYSALNLIQNQDFDFVFAVGDDATDEDLFSLLPKNSYTIKIGAGSTNAGYRIKSWKSLRKMLEELTN